MIEWNDEGTMTNEEKVLIAQDVKEVGQIMSTYVGIVRSNLRLKRAWDRLDLLYEETEDLFKRVKATRDICELRNMINVSRGCKGVKTLQVTEKTGQLVAIMDVNDENDLMIINKSGITIRTSVDQIPVQGRATQGVRVINLGKKNDCIGSVCKVTRDVEDEQPVEGAEGTENTIEENNN